MSARWADLTRYLSAQPGDRVVIEWDQFDRLVGGLPASAAKHAAWWTGERPHTRAVRDAGFVIVEHVVGRRVVFQRVGAPSRPHEVGRADGPKAAADQEEPDVVLVSCVKEKGAEPAEAQDLYVSALFRKARRHVEAMGRPWYILSAEHGLLKPSDWVAPYDRRLSACPPEYRAAWAGWVVAKLTDEVGRLDGKVVEIHAGASYVEPLLPLLQARGVRVELPLAGLSIGHRLAWYDAHRAARSEEPLAGEVVSGLRDDSRAMTPEQLRSADPAPLRRPGLYSWWADASGARDLTISLGQPVEAGLIYAGLAGATRSKSGRPSTNTLWGRLVGMHLGQRAGFSTFRLTLGSALFADEGAIDEMRLTQWMHDHLRVIAVPVDDADTLDELETRVLIELDPPLNLSKMPKTDLRRAVSAARKRVRDSI